MENTPGGKLAKMVKENIDSDKDLKAMKLLVLEKNGPQLARISNNIDPYKPDYCERERCFPCKTATKPTRGSCWVMGAAYRIICLDCLNRGVKAIYHGESGHSSHYRGLAHWDGYEKGKVENVMMQHDVAFHPGREPNITNF